MDNLVSKIKDCKTIAIVMHLNPDGDCIGSAGALLLALRTLGKDAYIFSPGPVASRLGFLFKEEWFGNENKVYDMCIAVDVAEISLMGNLRETVYDRAGFRCCIDHHATNSGYADLNIIDPSASGAGEVVFEFIKYHLKCSITSEIAMRLYCAVASDTGGFRYSNTTSKTLSVASELIKSDFDCAGLMRRLFEQKSLLQLKLNAHIISQLEFYFEGKVCVAVLDSKTLSQFNLTFEDTDDIASLPRSIEGVEVGVYIKAKDKNECKISLRSNEYVDVSSVAKELGGGGHVRASGVTVRKTLDETKEALLSLLEKVI